jgi:methyl-accepting chemotaxis protein
MGRLTNLVLDLRIGTKLAVASGMGVLLVLAMLAMQMLGNRAVKLANEHANDQQTIVKDAIDATASIRGMQIGVRDLRLARTAEDLGRASDYIAARQQSAHRFADEMLKLVTLPENRQRVGSMKRLIDQYATGAAEIAAVRSDITKLLTQRDGAGGAASADITARINALNEEAVRIAREKTLPLATELEAIANKIVDAAKHKAEEEAAHAAAEMASAERIGLLIGVLVALVLIGATIFSIFTIARPMQALTGGMLELAGGNFNVVLPGLGRKDEIGDVAGAVETFKVKAAEKAQREAAAKAEQDRQAAAEREAATARVMSEFDAAVGGIAKAAMAGDFSQRVPLDGKQGVILNLASAMNTMCDNVNTALDDLVDMLSALAEGDLTRRIEADYQGMFGTLKDNANTTAAQLADTVSKIKQAAGEVASAAAEISTSTTDLSQRTEEQAAGLEQTSASMEEISSTVKKNAENAQQANRLTGETREVGRRGGKVVADAVAAMSRIEESSRKIADIIGVIDEIARQTNLLALNAAVEAARAGEAGRGFAVVASEVRSLAQRSSQAAKDIKDLITSSSSQVHEGVELVNKAGTALNEIVGSIDSVAAIVAEIANASAEQATGLDQINHALSQMDEVTQQNSALVEENAATAKTLEQQSGAMDQQVAFFRLANAGGRGMASRGGAARVAGGRR